MAGVAPVAQNAGRQLQDVIVQVQGGTSAFTALSQQLPQFLDSFGAVGAVAGTLAAVAIPAAVVAFKALHGETVTLEDSLETLSDALKHVEAAARLDSLDALVERYGRVDRAALSLVATLKEVAAQQAASAANEVVGTFREFTDAVERFGSDNRTISDWADRTRALRNEFALSADEADRLRNAMKDAQTAQGLDAQFNALVGILDTMRAIGGSNAEAAGRMSELRQQVAEAADPQTVAALLEGPAALVGLDDRERTTLSARLHHPGSLEYLSVLDDAREVVKSVLAGLVGIASEAASPRAEAPDQGQAA